MSREEVLAAIQSSNDSLCCIPCCKQTNKVLPSLAQPYGTEFFTFKHNRKIRIINRYPQIKELCVGESVQSETNKTVEERLSDGEEYWFESAAPHRLPVVQPPPSVSINRIINKFEPRVNPNNPNSRKTSLENDIISPGRLPRKNFNTENLQDDDYEDEEPINDLDNDHINKKELSDTSRDLAVPSESGVTKDNSINNNNKEEKLTDDESEKKGDDSEEENVTTSETASPVPDSETDSASPQPKTSQGNKTVLIEGIGHIKKIYCQLFHYSNKSFI